MLKCSTVHICSNGFCLLQSQLLLTNCPWQQQVNRQIRLSACRLLGKTVRPGSGDVSQQRVTRSQRLLSRCPRLISGQCEQALAHTRLLLAEINQFSGIYTGNKLSWLEHRRYVGVLHVALWRREKTLVTSCGWKAEFRGFIKERSDAKGALTLAAAQRPLWNNRCIHFSGCLLSWTKTSTQEGQMLTGYTYV